MTFLEPALPETVGLRDMKLQEQIDYWKYRSRKNERRSKFYKNRVDLLESLMRDLVPGSH